jgi:hypothetical protein
LIPISAGGRAAGDADVVLDAGNMSGADAAKLHLGVDH